MLSTFELLQKYDVPGPRYTSYPTVPAWSESVTAEDYANAVRRAPCAARNTLHAPRFTHAAQRTAHDEFSLYFHIPFCEKLCHFCGCLQVITKDHSKSRPYVDTLLKEVDLVSCFLDNNQHAAHKAQCAVRSAPCAKPANSPSTSLRASDQRPTVSQIHFGGGTPNFLQPEELSRIMEKIRSDFYVLPDAEIAIEMHPRTSTHAFCDALKKEGFNRISLGVQDFDDEVQRLINRFQTYAMTKDMLDSLRSLGFDHFNFDLIYGLPGQNPDKWQETLAKTLTLRPNRLAVYSYAHVPWVRPVQRSFKDADLPAPETKLKLFALAVQFFGQNGYRLIGMDHFAEESDELCAALKNKSIHRNFMGYSTRADAHQIGFGVSGVSFVNGHYFQNLKDVDTYQTRVAQGKLATYRGFLLSEDDKIRRDLINTLMCHLEVDMRNFADRHKINFKNYFAEELKLLQDFRQDELLEISDERLAVTPRGHLVIRNIAMCFDKYLNDIKRQAINPVFSRTV